MASLENGAVGRNAGSSFRNTFLAVFAFIAQTDAGRAGEFRPDLSAGPMAENDSGKGRGGGESHVNDDSRNAQKHPAGSYSSRRFHPHMLFPWPRAVNFAPSPVGLDAGSKKNPEAGRKAVRPSLRLRIVAISGGYLANRRS